jgi:hypothetical protein
MKIGEKNMSEIDICSKIIISVHNLRNKVQNLFQRLHEWLDFCIVWFTFNGTKKSGSQILNLKAFVNISSQRNEYKNTYRILEYEYNTTIVWMDEKTFFNQNWKLNRNVGALSLVFLMDWNYFSLNYKLFRI